MTDSNMPQVFSNEQFGEIRVVKINGEPWFVGKDVAQALGYTNPQKAIRDHVDDDDKRGERIVHPSGGAQDTLVINESGVYSLIFGSKLPSAKNFKCWVTHEVLPSIRKTGAYGEDNKPVTDATMSRFIGNIEKSIVIERDRLALEHKKFSCSNVIELLDKFTKLAAVMADNPELRDDILRCAVKLLNETNFTPCDTSPTK